MAAPRIQRWALTLSAYEYTIIYRPGKDQGHADALSHLPLPQTPTVVPVPGNLLLLLEHLDTVSPVTAKQIKTWTDKDIVLVQVRRYVLHGWPSQEPKGELQQYWRKEELSVLDGCILWVARVIVPPPGRQRVIQELHETHPGIARMKSLARSYVWWPNMDADLEAKVRTCSECQSSRPPPASAPLHRPWEWPQKPWSRLHLDYAGPFLNRMFLVLVDAHSKWLEVVPVSAATSTATIEKLCEQYLRHMDFLRESSQIMELFSLVRNLRTSFTRTVLLTHEQLPTTPHQMD